MIFFAGGFGTPFFPVPVAVCLRVLADCFEESSLVNTGDGKHDRATDTFFHRRFPDRGATSPGYICITGSINDSFCKYGAAAFLAFGNDPLDFTAIHNGCHHKAMQQAIHATVQNQFICDIFEHFPIKAFADGLRFTICGTEFVGFLLELSANTFPLYRLLMPVPGKTFHSDRGDIAAKTALTLQHHHGHPGPGGSNCSRQPPRSAADNQYVCCGDYRHLPGCFIYRLQGRHNVVHIDFGNVNNKG